MQPPHVVVADVANERASKGKFREEHGSPRELRLQRVKERFGPRIVARSTHARALSKAVSSDEGAKRGSHVLGAAIAVENEAPRRAPTDERAGEHATRFSRRAPTTEGPGEHPTRVMIQHHGEIAPAVGEPEIRDVTDPHAVDALHSRFPHAVGMLREARANACFGAIAADRLRA